MIDVELSPEMLKAALAESMAPVVELELLRRQITVSPEGASKLLGIPAGTLKNWRCHKIGPAYSKVGSKILYKVSALEKYIEATGKKTNAC